MRHWPLILQTLLAVMVGMILLGAYSYDLGKRTAHAQVGFAREVTDALLTEPNFPEFWGEPQLGLESL